MKTVLTPLLTSLLIPLLIICTLTTTAQITPLPITPLPNAHAHNDYEHERPLLDALDNGFTSVEADVFLIEGIFYVYHDRPSVPDQNRTLEKFYLDPLKKRIEANGGYVYSGYEDFFYLMIDFKSEARPAYEQLKKLLAKYENIISVVRGGKVETDKPVKVFLSGSISGGPYDDILQEDKLLAGIDGRPEDLGKGIPSAAMPVVSDHYRKFLSWDGNGIIKEQEKKKLLAFVNQAHAEGKKVRLWASPDVPEVWGFLFESGVDLINTDNLPGLRKFLVSD